MKPEKVGKNISQDFYYWHVKYRKKKQNKYSKKEKRKKEDKKENIYHGVK